MGRYLVANSAMPTTAMSVKQPTGNNAIRTQLQIAPSIPILVHGWSVSYDGTTAATPAQCELIETGTVAATGMTALAAADVTPLDAVSDALGAGTVLAFGTGSTAFATAAVTEGTITATRRGDIQLIPPSSAWSAYWPLDQEFLVPASRFLRVRILTPAASVNLYTYVVISPA
jgi:hypothetical protein